MKYILQTEHISGGRHYCRWGYKIAYFDEGYYGLFTWMEFPENPEFAAKRTGFENSEGYPSLVPEGVAELPESARFLSIGACEAHVGEVCSIHLTWEPV